MSKSREQFEAWFNSDVFTIKMADPKIVNCYWDAWQASRKAIEECNHEWVSLSSSRTQSIVGCKICNKFKIGQGSY